jgi:hypothetical protein
MPIDELRAPPLLRHSFRRGRSEHVVQRVLNAGGALDILVR